MGLLSRALHAVNAAKLEESILVALRAAERAGASAGQGQVGVDIPTDGPEAALYAVVLSRILARNPELMVVRFGTNYTLVSRNRFKAGTSQNLFEGMNNAGLLTAVGKGLF